MSRHVRPARRSARQVHTIAAFALAVLVAGAAPGVAQVAPPSFPITVQDAIQYAVDNYAAVRASAARLAAQEANVDLTHTAYLPRLDSSLQVNRATRNNVAGLLLPGTTVPAISGPVSDTSSSSSAWGSAAGLLFSWEALDFGQREASMEVARSHVGRATAATALTRLEVGVRTADAFLRLASAQETVRAARANVDRQQVFAGTVAALVTNQLRPGAEDSRAQAELAAARIQLAQAEQAERSARAGLAQWLGANPTDVRITADALLAAPPPAGGATGSPAAHPLAATQSAVIDASQALQEALSRSYFPRVNLQSAFALRGTGVLANGSTPGGGHGLGFDTANWAVGVTATFPILDRAALRARTRIEVHQERAERATYDRLVQELSTQAHQAAADMEGARQVAQLTPVQLQAARVLEQQSRARYDAGLATIVEVADAQRLLLQAEVGDAVARLGVWRARLAEVAAAGDLSRFVP